MALLPEWAPVDYILLAWPYPDSDWSDNLAQVSDCYFQMLCAFTEAAQVCVLVHPSLDIDELTTQAVARKADMARISWLPCDYDDTWIRDYGPLSTSQGLISLSFNGWGQKYSADKDNLIFSELAKFFDRQITKHQFVGEGGALESNGEFLLMNADCVVDPLRNPNMDRVEVEQTFVRIFPDLAPIWLEGIVLTGDDTDGHIDTIARFANPSSVVYAGRNTTHADADILQSLHQQVTALAELHGWQCFELPSPRIFSRLDGHALPATYANFLIANDHVFAPIYGVVEDADALRVLKNAFPTQKIVPLRCEALLEQHGSLHCATMQVSIGL